MSDQGGTSRAWTNPSFVGDAAGTPVAQALRLGETVRAKARSGLALGTFVIELPTPATLRVLALAGFDFAVVDLEHSAQGLAGLDALIGAGHAAGLPILVRPWSTEDGLIGKILDMGANGVMAPRVDSVEHARAIVDQARYVAGHGRGFAPLTRYDALRQPLEDLNAAVFLILQIEGREGIARAAEIARLPGVDALFVGPYDLALSMGVPPGSERVRAAAADFASAMPNDLLLGIYVDDPARSAEWAARRFTVQCVGFDGRMLATAARALAATARAGQSGARRDG